MIVGGRDEDADALFALAAFELALLLGPCLFALVLVRVFAGEGSLSFSSPSGFAAVLVCCGVCVGSHACVQKGVMASTNVKR